MHKPVCIGIVVLTAVLYSVQIYEQYLQYQYEITKLYFIHSEKYAQLFANHDRIMKLINARREINYLHSVRCRGNDIWSCGKRCHDHRPYHTCFRIPPSVFINTHTYSDSERYSDEGKALNLNLSKVCVVDLKLS